jgi:hypothetical protein
VETVTSCISLSGQNPFGRVSGGSITLRGHLLSSDFRYGSKYNLPLDPLVRIGRADINFSLDTRVREHFFKIGEGLTEQSLCRSSDDSATTFSTPDVAVQLFYLGDEPATEESPVIQYQLVLGKSPSNPKFYERLGLLSDDGWGRYLEKGHNAP